MEDAKKMNSFVDIIINSRLYSITASTWNQHQQMLTAASQVANDRQRICWTELPPADTDDAVAVLAATLSHPPRLQQWHQTRDCVLGGPAMVAFGRLV